MNPTSNPTRRWFIAQAAGGAALGMALPLPLSAAAPQRVPDPILAAIESHKAARRAAHDAVDRQAVAESELRKIGMPYAQIGDDPRVTACEASVSQAFEVETLAACSLISTCPTTFAGVITLLVYANSADTDGEGWPGDLEEEGTGKSRSWHYFLIENLAETLPGLVHDREDADAEEAKQQPAVM